MNETKSFDIGLLTGVLLAVAGQAVNWLISPMNHPDAGLVRQTLVVAQAVVCAGAAFYFIRTRRTRSASPAV